MRKIQLRQEGSDVVYTFTPDGEYNNNEKWKRSDKNVTIVNISHIGWCVLDEDLNQVGWPFHENQDLHSATPPQGKWLSWKNGKSYIYSATVDEE